MKTDSSKPQVFAEENDRFNQTYRFLPDAVMLMRRSDKVILDTNAACEKLTGYSREEIVGQTSLKMVFFLDQDLWPRVFEQLEGENVVHDIEARILRKDSTIANVNISMSHAELDGLPCYLTTLRHINENKTEETAADKSLPQTTFSIDNLISPETEINKDEMGRLIDFRALQEMMNAGSGERAEWLERVHPDDRAHVEKKIKAVLARESSAVPTQAYEYEARLRHADGT